MLNTVDEWIQHGLLWGLLGPNRRLCPEITASSQHTKVIIGSLPPHQWQNTASLCQTQKICVLECLLFFFHSNCWIIRKGFFCLLRVKTFQATICFAELHMVNTGKVLVINKTIHEKLWSWLCEEIWLKTLKDSGSVNCCSSVSDPLLHLDRVLERSGEETWECESGILFQ